MDPPLFFTKYKIFLLQAVDSHTTDTIFRIAVSTLALVNHDLNNSQ